MAKWYEKKNSNSPFNFGKKWNEISNIPECSEFEWKWSSKRLHKKVKFGCEKVENRLRSANDICVMLSTRKAGTKTDRTHIAYL